MQTFAKIIRLIALSLLSGGSAAVVFTAVVLVKAATAHGVPMAEAATANAPIFLNYSKVALAAAVILAIGEVIEFTQSKSKTKLDIFRYVASAGSIACVLGFALGIVPPMERLLPDIKTVTEAHEQFHQLHELSRAIFGTSMLLAFISLILPTFNKEGSTLLTDKQSKEENQVVGINS